MSSLGAFTLVQTCVIVGEAGLQLQQFLQWSAVINPAESILLSAGRAPTPDHCHGGREALRLNITVGPRSCFHLLSSLCV